MVRKYIFIFFLLFLSFSLYGFEIFGPVWQYNEVGCYPNLGPVVSLVIVPECVDNWNFAIWWLHGHFVPFQFMYSSWPPHNMFWSDMGALGAAETHHIPEWPWDPDYWEDVWVEFNENLNWNYERNPNPDPPFYEFCFKTCCEHEMGHMAGLAHDRIDLGIMQPGYGPGIVWYINEYDVDGMVCLYGDELKSGSCHFRTFMLPSEALDTNTYICEAEVHVSCCDAGTTPNYTMKLYITYNRGSTWRRLWGAQENPGRHGKFLINFTQAAPNDRARFKSKWYQGETLVETTYSKWFTAFYSKRICLEDPEREDSLLLSSNGDKNYGCQIKDVYKIRDNFIYSLYDKVGRPIIKHKRGSEINEYLLKNRTGLFFLREESPYNVQLKKLIILEGNIIFDNKR